MPKPYKFIKRDPLSDEAYNHWYNHYKHVPLDGQLPVTCPYDNGQMHWDRTAECQCCYGVTQGPWDDGVVYECEDCGRFICITCWLQECIGHKCGANMR